MHLRGGASAARSGRPASAGPGAAPRDAVADRTGKSWTTRTEEGGANEARSIGIARHHDAGARGGVRDGTNDTAGTPNGLGNLIIVYNENTNPARTRTGSHNLIVGREHAYSSFGGIVSGNHNDIQDEEAACIAGKNNTASGEYAATVGAQYSTASGDYATVAGGNGGVASGQWSSVGGGYYNTSSGSYSWTGAGTNNIASAAYTSVLGGFENTASFTYATIAGGQDNVADGYLSTILGGVGNTTSKLNGGSIVFYSTIAGGSGNTVDDSSSTVGGGCSNTTTATCQFVP